MHRNILGLRTSRTTVTMDPVISSLIMMILASGTTYMLAADARAARVESPGAAGAPGAAGGAGAARAAEAADARVGREGAPRLAGGAGGAPRPDRHRVVRPSVVGHLS